MEARIIELFNQGFSYNEIGKMVGTSKENVRYHLSKHNLKRGYVTSYQTVKCECCGKEFVQKTINQRFCSSVCTNKKYRSIHFHKSVKDDNSAEIIKLHNNGLTSTEISNIVGVSSSTVRSKLKSNGLQLSQNRPVREFVCIHCGKTYHATKGKNKYCSTDCKIDWIKNHPKYTKVCEHCGKVFATNQRTQKLCSMDCSAVVAKTNFVNETIVNQYGTQEQRTSKFENDFNTMFKDKALYVGGFINGDGRFNCQCLKCGTIYSLGAQIVRKKGNAECPKCTEQERINKEAFNNTKRNLINVLKKVSRLKEKEQKELQKQLDYQNSIKEYECIYCGNKFMSDRYKKYCSNKCSKKSNEYHKTARRREMIKSNGHYDWSISIPKLIKRDKVCKLCGKAIDITDIKEAKGTKIAGDNYPSIDHIIPVSKGGTHTWDNVQLAHRGCNTKKNNKTDVIANKGRTQLSLNI